MAKGKVVRLKNPDNNSLYIIAIKRLKESVGLLRKIKKAKSLSMKYPDEALEEEYQMIQSQIEKVQSVIKSLLEEEDPDYSHYGIVEMVNSGVKKTGYFLDSKDPWKPNGKANYVQLELDDYVHEKKEDCKNDTEDCDGIFLEEK